jgi:hypothetical protein
VSRKREGAESQGGQPAGWNAVLSKENAGGNIAISSYFYYNLGIQAEHRAAGRGFCLLIQI